MILPSKHLSQDKALLTIGAKVLHRLDRPKTVSSVWEEVRGGGAKNRLPSLSYDWFVLSISLLYSLGAIELQGGVLKRKIS